MGLGKTAGPRLRCGYGDLSSATVWAEGSAQTRCADAVAPGLATFTQEAVMTRILRHLKLAACGRRVLEEPPAQAGSGGGKAKMPFKLPLLGQ